MMSFIKSSSHELQQQTKDIKAQLSDQIKCLEQRTDIQVSILHEINDFVKKRAELDLEYSKQLEKLTKSMMVKHKNEKQRRANWPLFSTCSLWQQLVDDTKEEARQRGITADVFGNHISPSITARCSVLHKISKKCREVGIQAQGELVRVLGELQASMKAYQMCYADFNVVKEKLRNAELSKQKSEDSNSLRKQKSVQKVLDKRLAKYEASRLKCNRARNEYLLCVEAANAAMHKFYAQDLADLIDCTDLGLEHWISLILSNMVAARQAICQQEMNALASVEIFRESLHLSADKQRFFESNSSVFMLPKSFEFKKDPTENTNNIIVAGCLSEDLKVRQHQINRRLDTLKKESNDLLVELDHQEEHIQNLLKASNVVERTNIGVVDTKPPAEVSEAAIEEASLSYTDRFRHHLLNGNLIVRLEARAFSIGNALKGNSLGIQSESTPKSLPSPLGTPNSPASNDADWFQRQRRKKRIGSNNDPTVHNSFSVKRPKLFGGSLAEYVDATGEEIPIVVTSCIRVLSHFALHHQGVFRISGSQVEINNMKEAFENGDDPLANVTSASDVNSISGVLKLYLRELREPLFPVYLFEQLTDCAKCSSTADFIIQITPLLNKLPRSTYLLLRYLFAFLNHLSQFSDENMMDPFNLAICFGPTLLPIPEDKDQVYYQNSVNDVVKNLIEYHDNIFSPSVPGPVYQVYDDGILFNDDADDPFLNGVPGSEASSRNDHHAYSDVHLMSSSLHGSAMHNGIPGMDRRLASAAAAVAQHRLSLYGSSSTGLRSPVQGTAVTSYEEGDERLVQPIRSIVTPTSQNGFASLITPLSTNSSTARTSISSESTASLAAAQKENGTSVEKQGSPKSGNLSKVVSVLQERSSIDSGIGANQPGQQKSPAASSNSSEQSKASSSQRSDRIRVAVVPKSASSTSSPRTMTSIPLSAQITYQSTTSPPSVPKSVSACESLNDESQVDGGVCFRKNDQSGRPVASQGQQV